MEIPSYVGADMEKCAEAVLKEVGESGERKGVMSWVERIANKNYTYWCFNTNTLMYSYNEYINSKSKNSKKLTLTCTQKPIGKPLQK